MSKTTLHQLRERKKARMGSTDVRKIKQRLYNSREWKAYTRQFKFDNPICEQCKKRPSYATDHVRPHGGDLELFWNPLNHQALCKTCHRAKSQRERHD